MRGTELPRRAGVEARTEGPRHARRRYKQAKTARLCSGCGNLLLSHLFRSRPTLFFGTIGFCGLHWGRKPIRQEADLIRDRNFRQTRRRDFDDDGYDPHLREFGAAAPRFPQPRFDAPSGPPVRAVVKWFKPERGFGFVELTDGSGDAFLHATVLERNGIAAVQPGETLEVRVAPGQKGPQVTEVLSVDSSTAAPAAP